MRSTIYSTALLLVALILHNQFTSAWKLQATLTQNQSLEWEGVSVALSADGNTLAVGAVGYDSYAGGTEIYTRSEDKWNYVTTLSRNNQYAYEGVSVSLSADGNTLASGATGYKGNIGITQIYVRSGNTWSHQASLTQNCSRSYEGNSVSLSADGNTLAAGASEFNDKKGATQIYVRSGSKWQHTAILSQSEPASAEGTSVVLSGDSSTLAAGFVPRNLGQCGTRIYSGSAGKWKFVASLSQNITYSDEGSSVDLSDNGTILAVGAPYANGTGATYIYRKTGDVWQYSATLSQYVLRSCEGIGVALAVNGNILIAGALGFNGTAGATQVYTWLGNTWQHQVTLSQKLFEGREGTSVALSDNNTTIASGAPGCPDIDPDSSQTLVYYQTETEF